MKKLDEKAKDIVQMRLATYEKPDINPGVECALSGYVAERKTHYGADFVKVSIDTAKSFSYAAR